MSLTVVGSMCAGYSTPMAGSAMSSLLVVDAIDGSVVGVVVMEECVDVSLNDEEASSEVLEPEDQEQEQEGSNRQ